jgi:hypothetical protein
MNKTTILITALLLAQVGLASGAAVGCQPFRTDNDPSAHKA